MVEVLTADVALLNERTPRELVELAYKRHRDRVYRIAFRYSSGRAAWAEDVAQDAFIRLWQHVGGLTDPEDLQGWLYRVTTNLCRDLHRKRQRRSELRAEQPVAAGGADGLSALALERVLGRLKPRERALVLMRGEGLSYAEMAAAADLRPSSVGQLLARAVRRFTTEYDREIGMEVDS